MKARPRPAQRAAEDRSGRADCRELEGFFWIADAERDQKDIGRDWKEGGFGHGDEKKDPQPGWSLNPVHAAEIDALHQRKPEGRRAAVLISLAHRTSSHCASFFQARSSFFSSRNSQEVTCSPLSVTTTIS